MNRWISISSNNPNKLHFLTEVIGLAIVIAFIGVPLYLYFAISPDFKWTLIFPAALFGYILIHDFFAPFEKRYIR